MRWRRGSAPTSSSTACRSSTPGSNRGRSGSRRRRSGWSWPSIPERLPELAERCEHYGVELADIGQFTGDGVLVVRSDGVPVLELTTDVPARRPPATPDDGRDADARAAGARRRASSTIRRRRCCACSPTATSPPRRARSIATTTRSSVPPPCGRWSAGSATPPPTASCWPSPPRRAGSRSGSGSTRGTGCTIRRRWPTPSSTRRSATSSPSAAIPTASRCSTTSRGATRAATSTLGELVAAVDGCVAAAHAYRAPFVSGKDSLNNEYTGSRRAAPLGATHARDHRRRPRARRRSLCDARCSSEPGNVVVLLGAHPTRVRRQSPRPRARRRPDAPGVVPAPDPSAPSATAACTGRSGDGLVQRLPRRQRGRAGGGAGRDVHRRPARDHGHRAPRPRSRHGTVRRVAGTPRSSRSTPVDLRPTHARSLGAHAARARHRHRRRRAASLPGRATARRHRARRRLQPHDRSGAAA